MGLLARFPRLAAWIMALALVSMGTLCAIQGLRALEPGAPHTWIMPTALSSRCRRETGSPCACLAMRATSGFESRTARTSHSRTFCVISRSMPLPMSTTRISRKDCHWPG